jgi:hypothetical protein
LLTCAIAGCSKPINVRLALVSLRFSTAMDILTDILIIALPMSLAYRVRLPGRTRLALAGVFALGGFIILFSIIRIIVTNAINKRPEVSWLNLWSAIEASISCIVCSLAPFKALFRGRIRTANNSYPLRYNPALAVEGKNMNSHELSDSYSSDHLRSSDSYKKLENTGAMNGRFPPSNPRKYPRQGLQTNVSADRSPKNGNSHIRDGEIVVTRQVDRKEMSADQVTLETQRSDEDFGRIMWRDGNGSAETIQPLKTQPGKQRHVVR